MECLSLVAGTIKKTKDKLKDIGLRLGKRDSAFRMFARFALVWFCLFSLPLGVWEGLRLRFVVCRSVCHFVLVFFSPFSIAIISLGEERANRSPFVRLFGLYLFGFVSFLFLLGSGKGCGL